MNKVIIAGNLGADPEAKTTSAGPLCNLSVATKERWKDKDGNKQERTEWHRVVVFGMLSETCVKYLSKGSKVLIEGKLHTSSYEKDGVKKYSTSIVASGLDFMDPRPENQAQTNLGPEPTFDENSEIPF